MNISVIRDLNLKYPSSEDFFSPDQAWPEYKNIHLAAKPNLVYSAVRKCLAEAGLDKENFGKRAWNPLGEYISPGNRVFLLCNFVEQFVGHMGDQFRKNEFYAKCTHGSVIRAVVDYVLLALQGKGNVCFGNAPFQSCDWSKVVEQTGAIQVQKFFSEVYKGKVKVQLVDLRQHIIKMHLLRPLKVEFHDESDNDTLEVNLGRDSLLESLYNDDKSPQLRVLDYDPRRMERCHSKGRHVYLMHREILESDVLISIPKLKTHEKVGITCGIKGCVGSVAHKDCLAHHRYGPPSCGGDEYPDKMSVLRVISAMHDSANIKEYGHVQHALKVCDNLSRKIVRRFTRALSGGWPGNDTCWRMAVDLARIVEYADKEGKLQIEKQRKHLMLTDGIIGGEGDGPLCAKPISCGYLSFSDNVNIGDYVNAIAMGFNPQNLPILREALKLRIFPLFLGEISRVEIKMDGKTLTMDSLRKIFNRKFEAPSEWKCIL